MAMLAGQQGGQPGQGEGDPLEELKDVIDSVHQLLATLPDPQDVHDTVTALRLLTGVQKRIMGMGQGNAGAQSPAAGG